MKLYNSISGESKIVAYDEGKDYIIVHFSNGQSYKYSYASAGADNVEAMRSLAAEGEGLNSFINQNVRFSYEGTDYFTEPDEYENDDEDGY